jgi:hypothetical protein
MLSDYHRGRLHALREIDAHCKTYIDLMQEERVAGLFQPPQKQNADIPAFKGLRAWIIRQIADEEQRITDLDKMVGGDAS